MNNNLSDKIELSPFHAFAEELQSHSTLFNLRQRYQLNGNMLLFILWLALKKQGRLTKKDLSHLNMAVTHWHERVLLPLRRFEMSTALQNSMLKIKEWVQAEAIFANQLEQLFLTKVLDFKNNVRSSQQQLTDACHNLVLYCKSLKIQLDAESREQITHLLKVIFPNINAAVINKACESSLQQLSNAAQLGSQLSLES